MNAKHTGETFGRFALHEKLGSGATAEVYRAYKTGPMGFRKEVALKRIRPDLDADDETRQHFLLSLTNEARLGAFLRHRNVVEVYDFGQVDEIFFIAMEFVSGDTLRYLVSRVEEEGPLPQRILCEIAMQLCDGLQDAHTAVDDVGQPLNLVHRDLKPANVMIDRRGVVKIVDFGIARAATNLSQTAIGTTKGTPSYMSPEQAMGRSIDHRSDLFSLGSVIAAMITGRDLFHGDHLYAVLNRIAHADASSLFAQLPDTFPQMEPVLRRALRRDPEERYPSAEEMGREIEAIRNALPGDEKLVDWLADHAGPPPDFDPSPAPSDEPATALSDEPATAPSDEPATALPGEPATALPRSLSRIDASATNPSCTASSATGNRSNIPDILPHPSTRSAAPDEFSPVCRTTRRSNARQAPGPPSDMRSRWPVSVALLLLLLLLPAGGLVLVASGYGLFRGCQAVESGRQARQWSEALAAYDTGVQWVDIAGGSYTMGDDAGPGDHRPAHRVWIESLSISRTEVTVGQYYRCVEAELCTEPARGEGCNWDHADRVDHPVNCVSWEQATVFAAFSKARLPTESEWEYIASSGGGEQLYPWGDDTPSCERAAVGPGCKVTGTQPPCSTPAGNSSQDVCDLAANLSEWVRDSYHASYDRAPANGSTWQSPDQPERVFRGGSFADQPGDLSITQRHHDDPDHQEPDLGFRLAKGGGPFERNAPDWWPF